MISARFDKKAFDNDRTLKVNQAVATYTSLNDMPEGEPVYQGLPVFSAPPQGVRPQGVPPQGVPPQGVRPQDKPLYAKISGAAAAKPSPTAMLDDAEFSDEDSAASTPSRASHSRAAAAAAGATKKAAEMRSDVKDILAQFAAKK